MNLLSAANVSAVLEEGVGSQHGIPNPLRRTHLVFLKSLEVELIDHEIPLVAWKKLRALWDENVSASRN